MVFTNAMQIAMALVSDPNIRVIQLGGNIRPRELATFGFIAEETVRKFWKVAEWRIMEEELLAYAILFYEEIIVTEERYRERLDSLFLANPDQEMLLNLEWETDIKKAMIYIRTHFDYQNLDHKKFGKILVENLKQYYATCRDIRYFAGKMYSLWESLPGCIQDEEPFWTLSYADDPLAWGDENQTRSLYEKMLNYYEN